MMKQFMHVGVPTDKIMEGAVYAEAIKTYIVAPETNEFNIEYLRFEKDTPLPKELQSMVHVLSVDLYYPEPYLYVDGGSIDFHGGGG